MLKLLDITELHNKIQNVEKSFEKLTSKLEVAGELFEVVAGQIASVALQSIDA